MITKNYIIIRYNNMNARILGRILLGSLFVASALKSFLSGFDEFTNAIKSKNIPYPVIIAIFLLGLKFVAGLYVGFGQNPKILKTAIISLVVFIILATFLFHNAFMEPKQFNNMFKNIAIIGGLLVLYPL